MKYILKLLFFACLTTASLNLNAQKTTPATGGNVTGTGGSVSFTVGQLVVSILTSSEGIIIHGVQQPYEISVVTGLETKEINLVLNIFPNPTSDILTLKIEELDREGLSYRLFNAAGVMLEDKKITGNETHISMGRYSSGIYYLKVTNKNLDIKTFKIIKN